MKYRIFISIVDMSANLENIDIDIDKGILQNIDIDKISYRLGFGISNTPNPLGARGKGGTPHFINIELI